jgi:hypothetical protein
MNEVKVWDTKSETCSTHGKQLDAWTDRGPVCEDGYDFNADPCEFDGAPYSPPANPTNPAWASAHEARVRRQR